MSDWEADCSPEPSASSRTRKGKAARSDSEDTDEEHLIRISRSSHKRRGHLTAVACVPCRRSKSKCVRSDPDALSCERCTRLGTECVAGEPRRAPIILARDQLGPTSPRTPTSQAAQQVTVSGPVGQQLLAAFEHNIASHAGLRQTTGSLDRVGLLAAYVAAESDLDKMASDQRALAAVAMATGARLVDIAGFEDARMSQLGQDVEPRPTLTGILDSVVVEHLGSAWLRRRSSSLSLLAAFANIVVLAAWAGSHPAFLLSCSQVSSELCFEYCRLLERIPTQHDSDERGIFMAALISDAIIAGHLDAITHIQETFYEVMFEPCLAEALGQLPDIAGWQRTMQKPATDAASVERQMAANEQLLAVIAVQVARQIRSYTARRQPFDWASFNTLQTALNNSFAWIISSAEYPGLFERMPWLEQVAWPSGFAPPSDAIRMQFGLIIVVWFTLLRTVQERINHIPDVNELARLLELDAMIRPTELRLVRMIAYESDRLIAEGHRIGCTPLFANVRFSLADIVQFACDAPLQPPEYNETDRRDLLESCVAELCIADFGSLIAMLDNVLQTWSWPQAHRDRLASTLQTLSAPPIF